MPAQESDAVCQQEGYQCASIYVLHECANITGPMRQHKRRSPAHLENGVNAVTAEPIVESFC